MTEINDKDDDYIGVDITFDIPRRYDSLLIHDDEYTKIGKDKDAFKKMSDNYIRTIKVAYE
jgi:hypothetical protein